MKNICQWATPMLAVLAISSVAILAGCAGKSMPESTHLAPSKLPRTFSMHAADGTCVMVMQQVRSIEELIDEGGNKTFLPEITSHFMPSSCNKDSLPFDRDIFRKTRWEKI
jgi:hypothetical protein